MRFKPVLSGIIKACGAISIFAVALLTLLVVADVVLRNLGLANWPWLNEITEYLLTISTFAGAPWVLHNHGHVNVDILLRLASPPVTRWVVRLSDVVGGLVSLVLLVVAIEVGIDTYQVGSMVFNNLVFPEWYLMVPVTLCFSVFTLEFLARIFSRGTAA